MQDENPENRSYPDNEPLQADSGQTEMESQDTSVGVSEHPQDTPITSTSESQPESQSIGVPLESQDTHTTPNAGVPDDEPQVVESPGVPAREAPKTKKEAPKRKRQQREELL